MRHDEQEQYQELKKRYEIDTLVHEIALNFINAAESDIDAIIYDGLARIGGFAGVDRSYVFQFMPTTDSMSNTHEWCSPGTSSHINRLKGFPMSGPYEWLTSRILNKEVIHIPSVSAFPSEYYEAKKEFHAEAIKSLVMVPLAIGDVVSGFLGFDSVQSEKEWSEHDVRLLELLGSVIAQSLSRVQLMRERDKSEQAVRDIVLNMNAMIFVADVKTCEILFVNEAAKATLGDISGKVCANYEDCFRVTIGGSCLDCEKASHQPHLSGQGTWEFYEEQKQRWYQCSDQVIDWYQGEKACLIIATDITETKQAFQALEHSQTRLNEAQSLSHIGNWDLDLESGELSWSDEIFRIFMLDPGELTPSYDLFIQFIHPDDRELVDRAYHDSVQNHLPYQVTHRLLLRGEEVRYVEERGETFYSDDGAPVRSIGTVQDITERKVAELTINKLIDDNQRLARESIRVLERERKKLSHELHDEMGQEVTAIKLEADYLQSVVEDHGNREIRKSLNDIIEISGDLLNSVRTVSEGLYPSILDQFSLEEALRELVETWANRDRDRVYRLHISEIPKCNSVDVKLAAYRVLQECLSNIVHHSESKSVDVFMNVEVNKHEDDSHVNCENMLRVVVQDDGIGFDPDVAMHGIGFLSMRERVLVVKGVFNVDAKPGKGCIVTACFPLNVDKSEQ
jgi:signal transduction histidine kinase